MAVKLELYRVFKEVAETGNISLAAKNLYISQSAVSQSIKQLETALQARLFARSPRGVSLTWEGQMLYQYVRSALGLLATGEDKLSQAQQLLLGTLTIGASDTVTSFFLTPYLEAFHRQHPGIRLKIVSGRSAKVLSMLKSGAVATSVSHDSHNIIVVGTSEDDCAAAANRVVELNGGIVVWDQGKPVAEVPLAIAGIMSDESLTSVNEKLEFAKAKAHELGVNPGIDPFMTLSFMALPVIPSLRITTRGVFDVTTQSYV